jgi:phage shock protein E
MKTLVTSITLALMALSAQAKDVIVDVRTPQEYAAGHVNGAINIPQSSVAQGVTQAGIGKDDTIHLYCQSGYLSGKALNTLKDLGYSKAENAGGIVQARKALEKP